MALEGLDTEGPDKHANVKGRDELLSFIEVMAYIEVGLGLLYYVMGCLCMQVLKTKTYADFERRGEEIKAAQKGIKFESPTAPVV